MTSIEPKSEEKQVHEILRVAEKNRLVRLVQLIHQQPSVVNQTDSDGYTPLHRASYGGHRDCVKYLLKKGANIEARTDEDWTPLHCAVRWNNIVVAEELVKAGANINAQSNGGNSPLHIVASNGKYSITCDIIQLLLYDEKCDFMLTNNSGDLAYDLAKRSGPFHLLWLGVMTLPE